MCSSRKRVGPENPRGFESHPPRHTLHLHTIRGRKAADLRLYAMVWAPITSTFEVGGKDRNPELLSETDNLRQASLTAPPSPPAFPKTGSARGGSGADRTAAAPRPGTSPRRADSWTAG